MPAAVYPVGPPAAPAAVYAYGQRSGPNGAVVAIANSRNQVAVFVINLLLGWTFVGWIAALVIAIATPQQSGPVVVSSQASATVHLHLPPGSGGLGQPNPGRVPPSGF